jgi:hypothetical protein
VRQSFFFAQITIQPEPRLSAIGGKEDIAKSEPLVSSPSMHACYLLSLQGTGFLHAATHRVLIAPLGCLSDQTLRFTVDDNFAAGCVHARLIVFYRLKKLASCAVGGGPVRPAAAKY